MSHLTFGQVQSRAILAGFVMSRRYNGIHLRYRHPGKQSVTWDGLSLISALRVVTEGTHSRCDGLELNMVGHSGMTSIKQFETEVT